MGSCCTDAAVKQETALKIKIRTPTRNFRHPFWCNSQPCSTVPWKWRMLIWKGCNGFFFSTLRRLSIYVPPVSLTEAALSCLQSIHHHGERADFMSASSAGTDKCDDVGRSPHGRQVWGWDGEIVFNLFTSGPNWSLIDWDQLQSEKGLLIKVPLIKISIVNFAIVLGSKYHLQLYGRRNNHSVTFTVCWLNDLMQDLNVTISLFWV